MQENQGLPQGWALVPLGSINESISTTKPELKPDVEFTYLDIASIDNKSQRVVNPQRLKGNSAPSRARQIVKINDILFSTVRTYLKNIAQVEQQYDGQIASTGFCVIRPNAAIEPKYAFNFVQSEGFLHPLSEIQRGTSYPAVRDSDVFAQNIPLPPLPEQRRIVAKLEELFSRLDAGVATLRQTQAQLKRYRQSVLHAAVTGELTRAWRTAQPTPSESGAALLQRIRQERRAQWEAAQTAKRGGQLPLNDVWKKKYEEPVAPDTSELPELPSGWVWSKLDTLAWDTGYGTSEKCNYENQGIPVLRIPNVVKGNLSLDDIKYSSPNAKIDIKETVLPGDLLIIRTNGSKSLIGRAAIVFKLLPKPHHFASYLIRFRLVSLPQVHQWVSTIWNSFDNRQWIEKHAASSAGQHNISLSTLGNMPIPLPPLAEQAEVVAEVERRLSVLDNLERTLSAELTRAERLRQSILHRAFTGQLVPQDAADEPAAALLARLREALAGAVPAKGKRGRQPKAAQTTLAL